MPEQLTTRTTASVEVARPLPAPAPLGSDQWLPAIALVVGGALILTNLVNGVLQMLERFRARREKEGEAEQGEVASLRGDVRELQTTVRDFMAAREIKSLVEAEKGHRQAGDDAAATCIADDRRRISDLERGFARLGAQFEGQAAGMARIELSVEKLGDRFDERFDKLAELVTRG